MTVCEKLFRDFKFTLPDHSDVKELVVSKETVDEPEQSLSSLLAEPKMFHERVVGFQLRRFEEEFAERYDIPISFTQAAARRISEKTQETGEDIARFCRDLFTNYEHGLKLLQQAPHKHEFVVDAEGVDNPAKALERWIKATYSD